MSAALRSVPTQPQVPPATFRLETTSQILDFDPGLYSVEVSAPETLAVSPELTLPCIRLDALSAGPGRAYVAPLSAGPMITPGAHPAYLRVENGKASVLLTIYKAAGTRTAPDLKIRLIGQGDAKRESSVAILPTALPSLKLKLLAHIERTGDVHANAGQWVGKPGSAAPLEGFSITPDCEELQPEDIEYQAVLGADWSTPWMRGGQFCGSRGMSLPLLGLRIRLTGEAARRYTCTYWASFVGKGEAPAARADELCALDGTPVEALRLVLDPIKPDKAAAEKPPGNRAQATQTPKPASPTPPKKIARFSKTAAKKKQPRKTDILPRRRK